MITEVEQDARLAVWEDVSAALHTTVLRASSRAARRSGRLCVESEDVQQAVWTEVWRRLDHFAELVDQGEERLINHAIGKIAASHVQRERDARLPDWQVYSGQRVEQLLSVLVHGRSAPRDLESLLRPPTSEQGDHDVEQADLLRGLHVVSESDRRVLLVRAATKTWLDACDVLDANIDTARKAHTRALRRLVAAMSDAEREAA